MRFISVEYVKIVVGVRFISVEYVKIVVRYEIHQCGVREN
jgi:hypothetical protein